ncbi:MAG: hypothetical protein HY331_12880 [Chloroflexi bacterium]|nr:hypothetical protein [Chloroflexota bacterium]
MYSRRRALRTLTVGTLGALTLLTGCQPEQRPGTVKTIGGTKSGSVSASVSSAPEAKATSVGAAATPQAAATTKGDGVFTPTSNVDIYQLISLDVAEIAGLTNVVTQGKPLPAQEILAIYEQGKFAKIGDKTRPLRGFSTNANRPKDFPDEAAFYKSPTFLDDPVIAAINGTGPAASYTPAQRRQAIQKGIQRILYYWSVQELMGAQTKLRDGNVDPASGAPHNVGEAWAIYVGAEKDGKYPYSLAATAQSREGNFERPGTIDKPMREAFARAIKAALDKHVEGFTQARADILSRYNALFYLASARYLNESVKSVQAGKPDDAVVQLMEGFSFYQTIQPKVAGVDAAADRTLVAFYQSSPSKPTMADRDQALAALNRAADALALKAGDRVSPAAFK